MRRWAAYGVGQKKQRFDRIESFSMFSVFNIQEIIWNADWSSRDWTTFRLDDLLHLLSSSYAIYPTITTSPRKEQGGWKGCPLFQSNKRAIVAQTAETVHAGSDTCRAHPLLKVPAMGMWASEPDHGLFYTTWLAGIVCMAYLGTPGTRTHYEKKASWQRQCDALGNVMLGNFGFHPLQHLFHY